MDGRKSLCYRLYMVVVDSLPSVLDALRDMIARRYKVTVIISLVFLLAAIGTYIAGQYQIGKLNEVSGKYDTPVTDYAATVADAKPESVERDVLEACKQSQIGSWLQTTDALQFKDPISGNRIIVQLDPSLSFIDINGREVSNCVRDEIENRQFDISSMTNNWALLLLVIAASVGGVGFYGYRINHPKPLPKIVDVEAEPVKVTPESPTQDAPESESR
jgi:hypothetical protein